MVGGATFLRFDPSGLVSEFTALPLQIFNWISQPQEEFKDLAAAGMIVLLGVLLLHERGGDLAPQQIRDRSGRWSIVLTRVTDPERAERERATPEIDTAVRGGGADAGRATARSRARPCSSSRT